MRIKTKAGYRWKRVATFKVHIDICSSAQTWRAVSSADKTEPVPMGNTDGHTLLIGAGQKFRGVLRIRRVEETT